MFVKIQRTTIWQIKYEQVVVFIDHGLTINIVLESQRHFQLSKWYAQTVLINFHPLSQLSNHHPTLLGVCYPWSASVLAKTNSKVLYKKSV